MTHSTDDAETPNLWYALERLAELADRHGLAEPSEIRVYAAAPRPILVIHFRRGDHAAAWCAALGARAKPVGGSIFSDEPIRLADYALQVHGWAED